MISKLSSHVSSVAQSSGICRYLSHFYGKVQKTKRNPSRKNNRTFQFQDQKLFYISGNENVLAPRCKNVLYFNKWNFLASFSLYFRTELSKLKKQAKTSSLKNSVYLEKWNFLVIRLKSFLYFRSELAKPKNQKFLIFLFTFFVC